MALAKMFEDFGHSHADPDTAPSRSSDQLEDEKLKSFEAGYGAGWDDAITAQNEGNRKLDEAMHQALLDMSATKQEVLESYILAMREVMEQIVDRVLPELADHSLRGHVLFLLEKAVTDHSDLPVEIRVPPSQKAAVSTAIGAHLDKGARVTAEPELLPHQALISLGPTETKIDLDGLIGEVREALNNFHDSVKQGG